MTGKSRKRNTAAWPLIAGLLAACISSPAVGKKTIELEGYTAWLSDWKEDSCVLVRAFGTGDNPVILHLEQFGPEQELQLLLTGDEFSSVGEGDRLNLQFGSMPQRERVSFMLGQTTEGTPTVFFPGLMELDEADAEIEQILVDWPWRSMVLKTGSFEKPLAAVKECMDELITGWGFDPEVQRNLSRPPEPANNPGSWAVSPDYPATALRTGKQSIVNFRLNIDAQGNATDCAIPKSYSGEQFDEITCTNIMRRARFEPALDADGNPVSSIYINTVSWVMHKR